MQPLSFFFPVKFFKNQPEILVISDIVVQPVYKHKEPVFHTQYQHQMQTHPYQPGKESSEM